MTAIQERLLGLVQEIDKICKKHEIPYYLSGGCVIGSLRHKGFIPWDDDIDILLDSKYWDKFYRVFQEEMPQNRTLGCMENSVDFPNMIYRYCDTSTTEIHKNELFGDSTAGVVIDIILMDSFPGGDVVWKDHMRNLLLFSDLVNVYYVYNSRFNVNIPYRRYMFLSRIFGKKRILVKLEQRLRKYEEQDCDYYMVRWPAGPNVFRKDIFGKPRYVNFEGISLPIPQNAGEFLRELYGDEWVEVPSPDKQNPHNTISDFERGYEEYFNEYVPRIDYRKAIRQYVKFKKLSMRTKKEQNEDSKRLWAIEGLKEKYLIEKRIQDKKLNPVSMLQNGEYVELLELFEGYMLRQGSSDYLGNEFWGGLTRRYDPVYIDFGDEYLSIMLWLWLYQGRLSKAFKVLRARKMVKGEELSSEVQSVDKFIRSMREAITLYEQEQYAKALEIVCELLEMAKCPIVNLWKLRIRLERKLGISDWKAEEIWIENCLKYMPEDGELLKYKADAVYREEGIAGAYSDYLYAYRHTRNGIIWMEIKGVFHKELPWALEKIENLICDKKLKEALELSEGWIGLEVDSLGLAYAHCYCLCFSDSEEERILGEKELWKYISEYPDDEKFRNLIKEVRKNQEKNIEYLEYEIRMKLENQRDGYFNIQQELLKDDRNSLYKIELLAYLSKELGEKRKEFELYRIFLKNGGSSTVVDKYVSSDIKKMINALFNAKTESERGSLVTEWSMKYPDIKESVSYLLKYSLLPEELAEQSESWIRGFLRNDEDYRQYIANLHKAVIMHRQLIKDKENDEI